MISTFDRQMEPGARNGLSVGPSAVAKGNFSRPIPGAIGDKSHRDRVLEHETQEAFLIALIAYEDGEASRQLRESLAKADRERKCIRHAMVLMVTLFILALAGLSYCALLLPEIIYSPTNLVRTGLSFLGLASLIAQFEFLGCLLWNRSAVNRLHKEGRRRVLLLVESQLRASLRRSLSADPGHEPGSTLASAPTNRQEKSDQL
jgi:hypothetical protein